MDELEAVSENHIPYEIIPGITAATGAAACTGIPLTARGYATAVRFLTAYKDEVVSPAYWKELAATNDTLVFYMSSETLSLVVNNLVRNGIDEEKLLAVVEQATTPHQQTSIFSLYGNIPFQREWVSPTLVIIGKVVGLHKQFNWFEPAGDRTPYFEHGASNIFQPAISGTC